MMMPNGLPILVLAGSKPRPKVSLACAVVLALAVTIVNSAQAADDAYRPPAESYEAPPPTAETYEPYRQGGNTGDYRPLDGSRRANPSGGAEGGYGGPYVDAPQPGPREEHYEAVAPAEQGGPSEASRGAYTQSEIVRAGHGFFGNVTSGLASAIEWAFQKAGRPNGYILGQDAGGAVVAGLRYGEGVMHTKDAGDHKVYWQGPSIGYDLGVEGSKVMVLVYNLRDPSDIYNRFGGVEGAAYLVGGVGVQFEKAGHVSLAPIRAGVGLRLGANVGYLKYTRAPTWNPF